MKESIEERFLEALRFDLDEANRYRKNPERFDYHLSQMMHTIEQYFDKVGREPFDIQT